MTWPADLISDEQRKKTNAGLRRVVAQRKAMTPSDLHLRMIKFESRVEPGVEG